MPDSEVQDIVKSIPENDWENDSDADKYVPSPYGNSDNSVVVV